MGEDRSYSNGRRNGEMYRDAMISIDEPEMASVIDIERELIDRATNFLRMRQQHPPSQALLRLYS